MGISVGGSKLGIFVEMNVVPLIDVFMTPGLEKRVETD
jgi:biopolymer transport protein ExbD